MIILIILIYLLVLNPYTLIGPLGYYAALPILIYGVFFCFKYADLRVLLLFLICIVISSFGVLSSAFHAITQFGHLKVSVSILAYYFIGIGLYVLHGKRFNIDDLAVSIFYVGVFNGVVILLQVQYPQLRAVIESVFIESGNVDWTEGFRYRGIASSGGASLSVFSASLVYICLYLYSIKKIGLLLTLVSISILFFSIFFIGRTGLLLIAVSFFLHGALHGWRNIKSFIFTAGLISCLFIIGFDFIKRFLIQEYGEGFYNYSLGFILDGRLGIESEGTVGVIGEFLTVVPKQFPEILIGYGFYGGSAFYPWTDSGYARMFLSVGFLFGFIFYAAVFLIFKKAAIGKNKYFWPLIILLAIAEVKEGMMFSGYSSRLIFIMLGFWIANKTHTLRQSINNK